MDIRKIWFVFLATALLGSCQSATSPGAGTGPAATLPNLGSTFHYMYTFKASDASAPVTLAETVTFRRTHPNQDTEFTADHTSDSLGAISANGTDTYVLKSNGDLGFPDSCGCYAPALPIATHRSYSSDTVFFPTKNNGFEAEGFGVRHTNYIDEENVTIGTGTLLCEKVQLTVDLGASDGAGKLKIIEVKTTYWYSAQLGYFARIEEDAPSQSIVGATQHSAHQLVSY